LGTEHIGSRIRSKSTKSGTPIWKRHEQELLDAAAAAFQEPLTQIAPHLVRLVERHRGPRTACPADCAVEVLQKTNNQVALEQLASYLLVAGTCQAVVGNMHRLLRKFSPGVLQG